MASARRNHTPEGGHIIGKIQHHAKDYGIPEGYKPTDDVSDLQALVSLSIQSLKKGRGKYPPTPEGLQLFKDGIIAYFQYIYDTNEKLEEQPVYPDVEGLCMYLRIDRATLFGYEKRGGEWEDVIKDAKTAITAVKKQLGSTFKIPPLLQIFDLTNNSGYVNSSEFKLVPEPPQDAEQPKITIKQLDRITSAELPELPMEE